MTSTPVLIQPIRKELHEAEQDITDLIKKEITEIPHLNQTLAYAIMGVLGLKNAEVVCMGTYSGGCFFSLVLIDGRKA